MRKFADFGISPALTETLRQHGITEATPVQEAAIPAALAGRDVMAQAQTGTGKTLAFLLPILMKLKPQGKTAQALVVTPTRELAQQIARVAGILGEAVGVTSLVLYGGQDIERQKEKLRRAPQLLIGTPGRLLDHLRRGTLDLSHVNKFVLDEADELLKLGFIEDVELLLKEVAPDRSLWLFSATLPARVRGLAKAYMESPAEITIKGEHVTLENIRQEVIPTTEETKLATLCEAINQYQPYLAMVFCRTKARAHDVTFALARRGYLVDELHGDLTQAQRAHVLKNFRAAKLQILVCTDVAARGLDIEGVNLVVSYDIPHDTDSYIHRIGRTGRAGEKGLALTFVNARQYGELRRIEAAIKEKITRANAERAKQRAKKQEKIKQEVFAKERERREKKAKKHAHRAPRKTAAQNNPRGKKKTVSNTSHRSSYGRH